MIGVLRRNPQFRRLWLSQVVSQSGDWLSRMAVMTVIARLAGTEAALGAGMLFAVELATRLMPTTVMGPIAGPVADRVPRRTLMMAADLLRAGIVLGLLLVDEPGELPLLYTLLIAQMSLAIFFSSAQSASIPNTVERDDLHEAYTLTAATWSMVLSVGALAGGLLISVVGVRGVFLLDSLTYLVSFTILLGLKLPPPPEHPQPFRWRDVFLLVDLRRGWSHARSLGVAPFLLTKSFWGAGGGFLVLLPIAAKERFAAPEAAGATVAAGAMGAAVGLLYCARGVGTGIGPILARRFHGSADSLLRRQITGGFFVAAAGYSLFPLCNELWLAFLCVMFAHCGGSALWVASTLAWQRHVEDAFRGRVFALEFLGMTLAFSTGGVVAGALYDATGSLSSTVWTMAAIVVVLGLSWRWTARRVPF